MMMLMMRGYEATRKEDVGDMGHGAHIRQQSHVEQALDRRLHQVAGFDLLVPYQSIAEQL